MCKARSQRGFTFVGQAQPSGLDVFRSLAAFVQTCEQRVEQMVAIFRAELKRLLFEIFQ